MDASPLFRDARPMNALRLLSRRRLAAAAGAAAAVAGAGALLGPGVFNAQPSGRHAAPAGATDTSQEDIQGGIMHEAGLPGAIVGRLLAPLKAVVGHSSPAQGGTATTDAPTPAGLAPAGVRPGQTGHTGVSAPPGLIDAKRGDEVPARNQPMPGGLQAPDGAYGHAPGQAPDQTEKGQAPGDGPRSQGSPPQHDGGNQHQDSAQAAPTSPAPPVLQSVPPTSTVTARATPTPTMSPSPSA